MKVAPLKKLHFALNLNDKQVKHFTVSSLDIQYVEQPYSLSYFQFMTLVNHDYIVLCKL